MNEKVKQILQQHIQLITKHFQHFSQSITQTFEPTQFIQQLLQEQVNFAAQIGGFVENGNFDEASKDNEINKNDDNQYYTKLADLQQFINKQLLNEINSQSIKEESKSVLEQMYSSSFIQMERLRNRFLVANQKLILALKQQNYQQMLQEVIKQQILIEERGARDVATEEVLINQQYKELLEIHCQYEQNLETKDNQLVQRIFNSQKSDDNKYDVVIKQFENQLQQILNTKEGLTQIIQKLGNNKQQTKEQNIQQQYQVNVNNFSGGSFDQEEIVQKNICQNQNNKTSAIKTSFESISLELNQFNDQVNNQYQSQIHNYSKLTNYKVQTQQLKKLLIKEIFMRIKTQLYFRKMKEVKVTYLDCLNFINVNKIKLNNYQQTIQDLIQGIKDMDKDNLKIRKHKPLQCIQCAHANQVTLK